MLLSRMSCCLMAAVLFAMVGCRTNASQSEEKSLTIPSDQALTLESWTKACKVQIDDPVEGAKNKAELKELAGTTDCAKAYPAISAILEQFGKSAAHK